MKIKTILIIAGIILIAGLTAIIAFAGIEATDAVHLDENKGFIKNIFDYIKEVDDITYTIPENQYVRVTFETEISNENLIDIFVKNNQQATIEVYEKDSDVVVGRIENVLEGIYYIDLEFEGNQSVFDLKSVGGDVIYDYIHDVAPDPPDWGTGLDGTPDVVTVPEQITYTATGTTDDNDDNYQLVVCTAEGITEVALNEDATCNVGTLCTSTFVAEDSEASCIHTTQQAADPLTAYGYLCDNSAQGKCSVVDTTTDTVNAGADTCTPSAGNWRIDCADNCTWDENLEVPENISIDGEGKLTLNRALNFSNVNWQIYKDDGCELVINSGAQIKNN